MTSPLEPFHSDAFRQMRERLRSLASPPASSPEHIHKQLTLPLAATSASASMSVDPRRRSTSPTPSPPASEASARTGSASPSQTPLSQASDSSSTSFDHIDMRLDHRLSRRRSKPRAGSRPNLGAPKRVLSEGDVGSPRLAKSSRTHGGMGDSMRSTSGVRSASASLPIMSASPVAAGSRTRVPSVATSWRQNLKRRRRSIIRPNTSLAFRKARTSSSAPAPTSCCGSEERTTSSTSVAGGRGDVLPELRLLSATRTAPIGWTRLASLVNPLAQTLEVYDERNAKQAPERQRFWPIIDHQLDYTGARMLSLSTTHFTHPPLGMAVDAPVSPKSLAAAPRPLGLQPGMASSDEDRSPLTPGAEPHARGAARVAQQVSRFARDAVRAEANRKVALHLSPPATLSAMIDFTRAQHETRQRKAAVAVKAAEPQRNKYGQLLRSPFSPVAAGLASQAPQALNAPQAPYAPPRIAPRSHAPASASKARDYFGHWETYLCGYGKESTF